MKKVSSLVLVVALVFTNLFIFAPTIPISNALQSWTTTSQSDFLSGILDNVSVSNNGDVKLASYTKYVDENFKDESKIAYKKNIIIDTNKGEAKLLKINKTFGGRNYDGGYSVQQTKDEGYIITGNTESYGGGDYDLWLIKIDCSGNEEWNRTFGGSNDDSGASIQQTEDGGYIIVGSTESYGAGDNDLWLIKTDFFGNKQWDKTFGRSDSDYGESVQQTKDGGYVIIGNTYSNDHYTTDTWLIKTDSSGNKQWDKKFGGSDSDYGESVQQTTDGGYVIVVTRSYGAGNWDIWLIKTDASGNKKWDKRFGGVKSDKGKSVQQTKDGGYIITGSTESYGAGGYDLWLIKTDSSGNKQWDKTFGGYGYEYGWSVQQATDDGYVVAGETSSYGAGDYDFWLIKTDSSGNMQWNRTFGGGNKDRCFSVKQTKDSGYVITGYTDSYGSGLHDLWLIKTDDYGNMQSTGDLISTNILSEKNVYSIDAFMYSAYIPPAT
ncbi:MAG: hypothetical protein AB1779_11095, partial [Candidatus Thermoplasmatota archaeon]